MLSAVSEEIDDSSLSVGKNGSKGAAKAVPFSFENGEIMKTDKGIIAYLALSAIVCATMIYYVKNTGAVPVGVYEVVTEEQTETTTETVEAKTPPQNSNSDVEVSYAFTDGFGIPHVMIKNNGENIYGYSIAVRYLDKDKKELDEKKVDIDAIVPSGFTDGLERFIEKVEGAEYISAAVTRIVYKDKTVDTEPVFSEKLIKMSDIHTKAKSADCAFINIGEIGIIQREGRNLLDLRFDVTSSSERVIKNISFLIAEYDKNGEPVSAAPNGCVREHIRKLGWEDAAFDPGEVRSLAAAMALNADCAEVNIIVDRVEFEDKGIWANPDSFDWIFSQNKFIKTEEQTTETTSGGV